MAAGIAPAAAFTNHGQRPIALRAGIAPEHDTVKEPPGFFQEVLHCVGHVKGEGNDIHSAADSGGKTDF